jgi:hypothetical protein
MPPVDPRCAIAWRVAITACLIGIAGTSIAILTSPAQGLVTPFLSTWRVLHLGWCVLVLTTLLSVRSRPFWLSLVAFAATLAPFLVTFWFADQRLETIGHPWVPFLRHKLAAFVIALLAPGEVLVGGVMIVLIAAATVAEYYVGELRFSQYMPREEPWFTVIICFVALVLLVHRVHRFGVERQLIRAQSDAARVRQVARLSLAVRDLANTPLQTLEIGIALLRRGVNTPELEERMARALDRLRELNRVMSGYEGDTTWQKEDESFDPLNVLREIEEESRGII